MEVGNGDDGVEGRDEEWKRMDLAETEVGRDEQAEDEDESEGRQDLACGWDGHRERGREQNA